MREIERRGANRSRKNWTNKRAQSYQSYDVLQPNQGRFEADDNFARPSLNMARLFP